MSTNMYMGDELYQDDFFYNKFRYSNYPSENELSQDLLGTSHCSLLLQKLHKAKENMTPVIHEIINKASIFTNTDYTNPDPCCCVPGDKFHGAIMASRILNEVNENLNRLEEYQMWNIPDFVVSTCVSDCAADPNNLTHLDRVYINRELIRQLIDLHEFLGMTIYRLRDIQVCRETKAGMDDYQLPQKKARSKQKSKSKNSGFFKRNTCEFEEGLEGNKTPKGIVSKGSVPLGSSQSKDVQAFPCCCLAKKPKKPPKQTNSSPKISKKNHASVRSKSSVLSGSCSDNPDRCEMELMKLQEEYNEINETLQNLKSMDSANSAGIFGTNSKATIGQEVGSKSSAFSPSVKSSHACTNKDSSYGSFNATSSRGCTNANSSQASSNIDSFNFNPTKTSSPINKAKSTNSVSITDVGTLDQAKRTILECLSELNDVRSFLREAKKVEVDLENSLEIVKDPPQKDCCARPQRHVHAKLNGIPVVLKIKESDVNQLIGALNSGKGSEILKFLETKTEVVEADRNSPIKKPSVKFPSKSDTVVDNGLSQKSGRGLDEDKSELSIREKLSSQFETSLKGSCSNKRQLYSRFSAKEFGEEDRYIPLPGVQSNFESGPNQTSISQRGSPFVTPTSHLSFNPSERSIGVSQPTGANLQDQSYYSSPLSQPANLPNQSYYPSSQQSPIPNSTAQSEYFPPNQSVRFNDICKRQFYSNQDQTSGNQSAGTIPLNFNRNYSTASTIPLESNNLSQLPSNQVSAVSSSPLNQSQYSSQTSTSTQPVSQYFSATSQGKVADSDHSKVASSLFEEDKSEYFSQINTQSNISRPISNLSDKTQSGGGLPNQFSQSQYIPPDFFKTPQQQNQSLPKQFSQSEYIPPDFFNTPQHQNQSLPNQFSQSEYIPPDFFNTPQQQNQSSSKQFSPSQYIPSNLFNTPQQNTQSNITTYSPSKSQSEYIPPDFFNTPQQQNQSSSKQFSPSQYIPPDLFNTPEQQNQSLPKQFSQSQHIPPDFFNTPQQQNQSLPKQFSQSEYIPPDFFNTPQQQNQSSSKQFSPSQYIPSDLFNTPQQNTQSNTTTYTPSKSQFVSSTNTSNLKKESQLDTSRYYLPTSQHQIISGTQSTADTTILQNVIPPLQDSTVNTDITLSKPILDSCENPTCCSKCLNRIKQEPIDSSQDGEKSVNQKDPSVPACIQSNAKFEPSSRFEESQNSEINPSRSQLEKSIPLKPEISSISTKCKSLKFGEPTISTQFKKEPSSNTTSSIVGVKKELPDQSNYSVISKESSTRTGKSSSDFEDPESEYSDSEGERVKEEPQSFSNEMRKGFSAGSNTSTGHDMKASDSNKSSMPRVSREKSPSKIVSTSSSKLKERLGQLEKGRSSTVQFKVEAEAEVEKDKNSISSFDSSGLPDKPSRTKLEGMLTHVEDQNEKTSEKTENESIVPKEDPTKEAEKKQSILSKASETSFKEGITKIIKIDTEDAKAIPTYYNENKTSRRLTDEPRTSLAAAKTSEQIMKTLLTSADEDEHEVEKEDTFGSMENVQKMLDRDESDMASAITADSEKTADVNEEEEEDIESKKSEVESKKSEIEEKKVIETKTPSDHSEAKRMSILKHAEEHKSNSRNIRISEDVQRLPIKSASSKSNEAKLKDLTSATITSSIEPKCLKKSTSCSQTEMNFKKEEAVETEIEQMVTLKLYDYQDKFCYCKDGHGASNSNLVNKGSNTLPNISSELAKRTGVPTNLGRIPSVYEEDEPTDLEEGSDDDDDGKPCLDEADKQTSKLRDFLAKEGLGGRTNYKNKSDEEIRKMLMRTGIGGEERGSGSKKDYLMPPPNMEDTLNKRGVKYDVTENEEPMEKAKKTFKGTPYPSSHYFSEESESETQSSRDGTLLKLTLTVSGPEKMPSEMQSDPSVPYNVDPESLPEFTTPKTKLSNSAEKQLLYSQMKSTDINYPNKDIESELQQMGLDNLMRAGVPAKCCRKSVLNEKSHQALPYPPSLQSLPLDENDVMLIRYNAGYDTECSVNKLKEKDYAPYPSDMKDYTTLQSQDMPWSVPSYEIRFFQFFRKDEKPDESKNVNKSTSFRKFVQKMKPRSEEPKQSSSESVKSSLDKYIYLEYPLDVNMPFMGTNSYSNEFNYGNYYCPTETMLTANSSNFYQCEYPEKDTNKPIFLQKEMKISYPAKRTNNYAQTLPGKPKQKSTKSPDVKTEENTHKSSKDQLTKKKNKKIQCMRLVSIENVPVKEPVKKKRVKALSRTRRSSRNLKIVSNGSIFITHSNPIVLKSSPITLAPRNSQPNIEAGMEENLESHHRNYKQEDIGHVETVTCNENTYDTYYCFNDVEIKEKPDPNLVTNNIVLCNQGNDIAKKDNYEQLLKKCKIHKKSLLLKKRIKNKHLCSGDKNFHKSVLTVELPAKGSDHSVYTTDSGGSIIYKDEGMIKLDECLIAESEDLLSKQRKKHNRFGFKEERPESLNSSSGSGKKEEVYELKITKHKRSKLDKYLALKERKKENMHSVETQCFDESLKENENYTIQRFKADERLDGVIQKSPENETITLGEKGDETYINKNFKEPSSCNNTLQCSEQSSSSSGSGLLMNQPTKSSIARRVKTKAEKAASRHILTNFVPSNVRNQVIKEESSSEDLSLESSTSGTQEACNVSSCSVPQSYCFDQKHTILLKSVESANTDLFSKEKTGYISILKPTCGCPEVSVFVPCFCHKKVHYKSRIPKLKRPELSPKRNTLST